MPDFDPNSPAAEDSGIFGLPDTQAAAALVYLPVPWEATTSYGAGASQGPAAILAASRQVDLFDGDVLKPYACGLHMLPESRQVRAWNRQAQAAAQKVIAAGGEAAGRPSLLAAQRRVNALGGRLNAWVRAETGRLLDAGKLVGLVGGDHSTPYGALQALAARTPSFGVLHFDAHCDLRDAYEGFRWSHASIMRNVLEDIPGVKKLVQIGIRDYCEQEYDYARAQGSRIKVFFDGDLARRRFAGESWDKISGRIAAELPRTLWISFDIDGLDPRFCPHTGTPVPGGLDFREALYVIEKVVCSGRKILGFDLNEVAPDPARRDEWDANVGARLLYKLSAWTLASQGRARIRGTGPRHYSIAGDRA
ncbi:MAG: agmatinase family protein [Elusimicrobiota bacterium]|jgi:agmatinase